MIGFIAHLATHIASPATILAHLPVDAVIVFGAIGLIFRKVANNG